MDQGENTQVHVDTYDGPVTYEFTAEPSTENKEPPTKEKKHKKKKHIKKQKRKRKGTWRVPYLESISILLVACAIVYFLLHPTGSIIEPPYRVHLAPKSENRTVVFAAAPLKQVDAMLAHHVKPNSTLCMHHLEISPPWQHQCVLQSNGNLIYMLNPKVLQISPPRCVVLVWTRDKIKYEATICDKQISILI